MMEIIANKYTYIQWSVTKWAFFLARYLQRCSLGPSEDGIKHNCTTKYALDFIYNYQIVRNANEYHSIHNNNNFQFPFPFHVIPPPIFRITI